MKKFKTVLLTLFSCLLFALANASSSDAKQCEYEIDSYHMVDMWSLYSSEKLTADEKLEDAGFDNTEEGKLYITDKVSDLNSGKLIITEHFNFDANPVGRISLDGVAEAGVTGCVDIYIDDEQTPITSLNLNSYSNETGWDVSVSDTKDVYINRLQGEHSISLGFNLTGKADDEQATVMIRNLEFAENSLPVLYFDIDESKGTIEDMNESMDHSVECHGKLSVQIPDGYQSEYTEQQLSDLDGLELDYIRGRGNATWGLDKKPYKFKLGEGQDLFGMGKNKHWTLLTERYDNSRLRNRITNWLGNEIGLEYTPQCVFVEVVMNGRYLGTYLLSEQVRVGKSRVDIDELSDETDENEITGGYLFSYLSHIGSRFSAPQESRFSTDMGNQFIGETPDFYESGNDTQKKYLNDYVQTAENAVYSGENYTDYIDTDSFVRYWWLQEIAVNHDAYGTPSTYMYKKRDGKLYLGPIWDLDMAWGNLNYNNPQLVGKTDGFDNTESGWIEKLKSDNDFVDSLKEEWNRFDEKITELTENGGVLDRYYEEMYKAASYDYETWGSFSESSSADYKEEVEQLRAWIIERRNWINDNKDMLDHLSVNVTFMVDDEVYTEMTIPYNTSVPYLPEPDEKDGYVFKGWYTDEGMRLGESDPLDKNMVFYAKYIDHEKADAAEQIFFGRKVENRDLDNEFFYPEYSVYPDDAVAKGLTWESSDESVATVDDSGKVSFIAVGETEISVTTESGNKSSFLLRVVESSGGPGGISELSFSGDVEVPVGEYVQVLPDAAPIYHNIELSFSVEDDSVATADAYGVVTGKMAGETTLTVTESKSGLSASCKIKVTDNANDQDEQKEEDRKDNNIDNNKDNNKDNKKDNKKDSKKNSEISRKENNKENKKDNNKSIKAGEWINGKWKSNTKGWWYEDINGNYPVNKWQEIDGKWYYFDELGYMCSYEYREGYWLDADGAWAELYSGGHWMHSSKGWWYTDVTGWYPYSQYLKIDGKQYRFDKNGYFTE